MLSMNQVNHQEESMVLKDVLRLRLTDYTSFLFYLGRYSEDEGLPTVSHVFYTEALAKIDSGVVSKIFDADDIRLSIERLTANNPGLLEPNTVEVITERQRNLSSLIHEAVQSTVVRSIALLLTGSLIPLIIDLFS